jgi:hypothetical protein
MHVAISAEDEHAPVQLPLHVPLQSALQLKLPGLAMQLPMHEPWQLAWQLGNVAVHPPAQLASSWASHATCRLGGAQATSHDALTSAVHVSLPLKTAPPQSEKMSARAYPAARTMVAAAARARSEEVRFTSDLLKISSHDETGRVEVSFNAPLLGGALM